MLTKASRFSLFRPLDKAGVKKRRHFVCLFIFPAVILPVFNQWGNVSDAIPYRLSA
ncbi:hypothetical protein J8L03_07095 [Bacteroides fragilis]|uniref:hypothetical protein n=1 Tax=Bacteroides fragilis TaxID=817 RepID=UPI00202FA3D6|nr:hypothetical protein [Bacteroides fragilis]MCM0246051.1 hypothetical protein [Bacteroides fragilis]